MKATAKFSLILAAAGALLAAMPAIAASYTFTTTTFAWHDPVASGDTRIVNWANPCSGFCDGIGDDSISAPVNLGFTFNFAGTNYTQLQVQTDGRVMFNNNYSYYGTVSIGGYNPNPSPPPPFIWTPGNPRTYTLQPLPQGTLNNSMVVYGTDVDVSPNGSGGGPSATGCSAAANTPTPGNNYVQGPCGIYYQQIPNGCGAGCSQFVVTWLNVPDWGDATSSYTFQVIINQNGTFIYQYNTSINPEFGQAEVGYQGASVADYVNYNYPAPTSPYSGGIGALAGTAVLWVPIPPVVCGKFNAFEHATPALAGCGVINTKIAGAAFNLDLVAVTALGVQDNAFTGTVSVDLIGNTAQNVPLNPNNCPTSFSTLMVSPFNVSFISPADRLANVAFPAIADVWQDVRVRMFWAGPPATTICSSDNFAIRPASLKVAAFDANWTTAGNARALNNAAAAGGNVHQAGMPFQIAVTALNAAGTAVSNYNGSPTVLTGTCIVFDLPLGCNPAALLLPGGASWVAGNPMTNNNAAYSEAGAFSLVLEDHNFASVDAPGNEPLATLAVPASPAATIGRFVPASFTVVPVPQPTVPAPKFATFGVPDASCNVLALAPVRSFTYVGQPFGYVAAPASNPPALVPQMTVTAVNASGATTTNYRGSLWKLAAATGAVACAPATTCTANTGGITQTYTSVGGQALNGALIGTLATPGSLGAPVLTVGNGALQYPYPPAGTVIPYGVAALSSNVADVVAFLRSPTTPVVPFNANIALNVTASDASEGANGTITTSAGGATFNGGGPGMAFDGVGGVPAGSQMFYGRMKADNAAGSELLPLLVTLHTQYWPPAGGGFVANTFDNCTTLAAANVGRGNFQLNLTAAQATPTIVNANGSANANGALLGGLAAVKLSAPGAGRNGALDLVIDLEPIVPLTPISTCVVWAVAPAPTGAKLAFLRDLQSCSAGNYDRDPTAHATFGVLNNNNPQSIYLRENY